MTDTIKGTMGGTMKGTIEGTMKDNMEGTMEQQEGGGLWPFSKKTDGRPKPTPEKYMPEALSRKQEARAKRSEDTKKTLNSLASAATGTRKILTNTIPSGVRNMTKKATKYVKPYVTHKPYTEAQLLVLTKDLSPDDYTNNIKWFSRKFNEYLEKLLNVNKLDELNLQRLRIIQLLSEIRSKDVQTMTITMFSYLADFNKHWLASNSSSASSFITTFTDFNKIYERNGTIDIIKVINDNINKNYNAINSSTNKEWVKQFLLELLTIYYYPTIILFIIYLKMIEYIDIIKTTRDKIIDDVDFRTMINSLLTVKIENREARVEREQAAARAVRAEAGAPALVAERLARARAAKAAVVVEGAAPVVEGAAPVVEGADMVAEARAAMPEEARAVEGRAEEANRIRHEGQNEKIRHRVGRAGERAVLALASNHRRISDREAGSPDGSEPLPNIVAFLNKAGEQVGISPIDTEDASPAAAAPNQRDPAHAVVAPNTEDPADAVVALDPRARHVPRAVIDDRRRLIESRIAPQSGSDTDDEYELGDRLGGTMTGGTFDFNIIKTYNNSPVDNPYLNSSGTMFYNALINFAVSISINNKSEFEELMLDYLKEILIAKFNIIFNGNFDNDEELNRVKGEFEDIKKDLDSDTNGKEFIKAYNESKEAKSQLEKLIKEQEDKPTMNIAEYTDQKEDLEGKINRSNKIINVAQDLNDKKTSLQIKTKIVKYIDKDKLLEWLKEQSDKTLDTRKTINELLIYMFASPNDDKITTTASASSSSPLVSASPSPASPSRASYASRIGSALGKSIPSMLSRGRVATDSTLKQAPIPAVVAPLEGIGPVVSVVGGSTNDDIYCLKVMRKSSYRSVIDKSIVKGIGQSSMFTFLPPAPETTQQADTSSEPDPELTVGGNRSTRRYKKRRGTRRQQKRKGTHRKRKNTTR